jgi:hypothetical protein
MVSRRAFLGAAFGAATVAATPFAASLFSSTAFAAGPLRTRFVNNTGTFRNDEVTFYVVGTDLSTGQQGFVKNPGVFTPAGGDGVADAAIALGNADELEFALPPNFSGRVYFSLGDRLEFKVVAGGNGAALQFPAGWVENDPSFGVLHDFVELTHNDLGIFTNATTVDQFSIPAEVRTSGTKEQVSGTMKAGARQRVAEALAGEPGFEQLLVADGLRVIAPGHALDGGRFPATYFDPYVDQVFQKYAGEDFTASVEGKGEFTGRVAGDSFVFDRGVAPFARPKTRDVLFCDGALVSPNDGVTGPIGAILCASLNRTTMLDAATGPVRDAGAFYQEEITNHYSRVLHENAEDGRAYGFAFDDVAEFASFHQESAPTEFVVRLTPFGPRP